MSEIDRLSNSGLYPALPVADRKDQRNETPGKPPRDSGTAKTETKAVDKADPQAPRPPKSIIDEYA